MQVQADKGVKGDGYRRWWRRTYSAHSCWTVCRKAFKAECPTSASGTPQQPSSLASTASRQGGKLKTEAESSMQQRMSGCPRQEPGCSPILVQPHGFSPTGVQLGRPYYQHLPPAVSWSRSCSMESLLLSTQAWHRTTMLQFGACRAEIKAGVAKAGGQSAGCVAEQGV